jgi:glycosyltransferase involved in cell wall biosynthesis
MAWGSDVLRANRIRLAAGRYAIRRAALVMSDSHALMARLEELGASPERTFLVNWGVDLETFAPPPDGRAAVRARLGLQEGPTVISPRSLMPVYNVPMILKAFDRAGARLPDLRLLVKHMGPEADELGAFPHAERVDLVGHVAYEAMADYYRAADVCVSLASSDSSPRSVWEAMACGCALVVSDLLWVHELIEHERHALVVPIEAGAVADAIERLVTDEALAARLGANARRLVEEHRDRGREMARLSDAYVRLAGA